MYSPPLSRSMLGDFLESFQRDSPTVGKNSSPEKKKQNTTWRSNVISPRAAERMEQLGAELSPTLRSGWTPFSHFAERMEQLGAELEAHHSLYTGGVSDEQEWRKEADDVLCRFPHPSSMTEGAPLLLQLKEWQRKGWLSEVQFKGVTEKVRAHIKNVQLVSTRAAASPGTSSLSKQAAGDGAKHCPAHEPETIGKKGSKKASTQIPSQTKRSASQTGLLSFGFAKRLSSRDKKLDEDGKPTWSSTTVCVCVCVCGCC